MKGTEMRLVEYMDGAKKRFVIPVYQRNYDWKIENCKQLIDDLEKISISGRKSHFFGSVVSVFDPAGKYTEFLVIDGQQRLTTISLLFLAMYNLLKEEKMIAETSSLAERIYEEYLVDKWQPEDKRIKLKSVKNDQKAFEKLFCESSEHDKGSNITANYNYLYERIINSNITIDQMYDSVCKLEIINIILNNEDNPQLIFESLNSTGLALSEGDKIRNFILMGLSVKEQELFYEKYWNRIEINVGYDVSSFVRDYLSVKQQSTPALNKIYLVFKSYVEDKVNNIEELLKDLLKYAKYYNSLLDGKNETKRLQRCIYRLNHLETTVTRPFFLEVLRMKEEEIIDTDDTVEIFELTENYIFRRAICDIATNQLNKIFLTLNKEIEKYDGTNENYLEKFKYAIIAKKERGRFPNDIEFKRALTEKQIYLMNSKNRIYLLEKYENIATKEVKDMYASFEDGVYSIEHIMPQHLNQVWVNNLGENYKEIHEKWLHRLANLTITAYNSKYSNNEFIVKRNMENGFLNSGIKMNQFIAQKEVWREEELEERSAYMAETGAEIWHYPKTQFEPEEKQFEFYTLEDDINMTGRLLVKFSYKNIEQPALSWVDMYEKMLRTLCSEDSALLSQMVNDKEKYPEIATYISSELSDLRNGIIIQDGIYAERNTSTWTKTSLLKKLFKYYGIDLSELIFFVREDDEKSNNEAARYEMRKAYWEFALSYIKEENIETHIFDKAKAGKENWISGVFNMGGIYISCVSNYDCARAELYIGKQNKDINKEIFDIIWKSKDKIESELGVKLKWDRRDDKKSSGIIYELQNVSIIKKEDWLKMAQFQAKWSKKLYNIFMPYLENIK